MRTKLLLITLLLLLMVSLSHAATYYVATTGSDAVSCATAQTIGTPKQTIASVRGCATAGDTIDIRGGTYAETILNGFGTGTDFTTGAINITAHTGETVIWTAAAANGWALTLTATTQTYLIFTNIIFDGVSKTRHTANVSGNPGPVGAHHIRFVTCEFRNHLTEVNVSYTHHNEFIGGSIHDSGDSSGLRHGIYISTQGADNLIDGMTVYNNLGYGIHLWAAAGGVHRNIIRNNTVHSNGSAQGSSGIVINGGDDNVAYNNVLYNNVGGGIVLSWGGGTTANRTLVYNNTIVGNGSGRHGLSQQGGSGHVFRSNLLYQNAGNDLNMFGDTVQSNNLCVTGNAICAAFTPGFVDAGARNYHLVTGSSAIDTGYATPLTSTDKDGITWSTPKEIGAYNFGTAVSPIYLKFSTQPSNAIATVTIAPAVVVCAYDASDILQTTYANNISLAISDNPASGTLTGGTGGAPTSGCRTFSLSIDNAGSPYTLIPSGTDATGVESVNFTISTAAAAAAPGTLRLHYVP